MYYSTELTIYLNYTDNLLIKLKILLDRWLTKWCGDLLSNGRHICSCLLQLYMVRASSQGSRSDWHCSRRASASPFPATRRSKLELSLPSTRYTLDSKDFHTATEEQSTLKMSPSKHTWRVHRRTRTHTHIHMHICTWPYTHACTHARTHTHAYMYAHTHACIYVRTHTHTHTFIEFHL